MQNHVLRSLFIVLASLQAIHAQVPAPSSWIPVPGVNVTKDPTLYSAAVRVLVQPGDYVRDEWPGCQDEGQVIRYDIEDQLTRAATAFTAAANMNPALKAAAVVAIGPIIQQLVGPALRNAADAARKNGGDGGFIVFPDRRGDCKPLAVALPVGARVLGFHYFVSDRSGANRCIPDGNGHIVCNLDDTGGIHTIPEGLPAGGVAFCGWETTPRDEEFTITPGRQVIGAVFKNWSADRPMWATFVVIFRPPEGWNPSGRVDDLADEE